MENIDSLSIFTKFKMELDEDLKLEDFNIKDTQLKLPGIKHKWVARCIQKKIDRNKLKKIRLEAIEKMVNKIRSDGPVMVSDKTLALQAEATDIIKRIDEKLTELDFIIEYLEKVEKITSMMTYDIKNLTEIYKKETI